MFGRNIYAAYRKVRFLSHTGSLFTVGGQSQDSSEPYPRNTFLAIMANSSVAFLLSYFILYLISLFATAISASAFNISVIIFFQDVEYLIQGDEWTHDAVTAVFSAAPLVSLILAISFMILYVSVAMETGFLRLILVWMLLHSITRFLGDIIVGSLFTQGLGYVIQYLWIMDTGKLLITIIAFVAIFTTGLLIARVVLYSSNIFLNHLSGGYKFKLVIYQFMIPFIIGNILIFLIKLPVINPYDIALNGSMLLLLVPILMRTIRMNDLYFDTEPRVVRFFPKMAMATILAILGLRIILEIGIPI